MVAGDEVGVAHEVGGTDGLRPEPQVRHRHGARLLGVVHEVTLYEGVGGVDDDLDAVLVGPNGAVRTQPEKDGLDLARRPRRAEILVPGQAERRHVVENADREMALGHRFHAAASSSRTALAIAGVNSLEEARSVRR